MDKPSICIVGLGYVGLPLAHAFAKQGYSVFGLDINSQRIEELKSGIDRTDELTTQQLQEVEIEFSDEPEIIGKGDIVILAIPTPIDEHKKPNLKPVEAASKTVGAHMKKGAIIVYESTVYPGTTEDICGPILEEVSGMTCGTDFTLGYSPERINPGDKEHTVQKIVKVVAGQDEETTDKLVELYEAVILAGVHRAPSIKVAEMAKAIENAQRDLNIAFMNEIAMLSNACGISSADVFAAAKTKWNFLPFQPGLVGGHCIGVDPYYLVEKAEMLGMNTHVIAAGRSVNDSMSDYVVEQVLNQLDDPKGARVLVLGLTFKEDVPDTRNSKAFDVVDALYDKECTVEVHDPHITADEIRDMKLIESALQGEYDAVLYLVPHREYKEMGTEGILKLVREGGVIYDLKSLMEKEEVEGMGRKYLAL